MAARIAFFFADLVRWRLERHLNDARATPLLLRGLNGSMVTRQAFDLEDLAHGRIAREAFMAAYGHCAANELEISRARLAEDPETIDNLLQELAVSARRPYAEFQKQQRQRRAAQRAVRRQLVDHSVADDEIRAFFADLRLAQAFLPLRETIKHCYTGVYRALRDILLEINRRLGWDDGDVFYLEPEEIKDCFRSPDELAPLARERRRDRQIASLLAAQQRIPAVVFADDLQRIGERADIAVCAHLQGAPVAPGCVVGQVMLLDESAFGAPPGKGAYQERIIVARSANLGLAPWLRVAAGLIVEVGGVLAHAACQARESGIPAVVLEGATSLLCEGMRVRLDGETGRVEILEQPDDAR
jgi:pyruvate,water dikinase